jgi:uncharacterized protein
MTRLDQFTDQLYLNLETLRKSGQAMPTPIWFVQDGDMLYIRTTADSGKEKRVRNNPQVRIAPCGREGRLLVPWIPALAREVHNGPIIEAKVDQLLDEKYGEIKRQLSGQA